MAVRGYPGIHAGMPTAQCLRSASGNGAGRSRSKARAKAKANLFLIAYISVAAVTAAYGFALTASPFSKRRKGTKRLCPTIRCLANARHALTPALLRGPAAIGHPWPCAAIPASMPGCPLRNACVRPLETGQVDQDQKPEPEPKPKPKPKRRNVRAIDQAGQQAASLLLWLLIFLPHREAEWRFCAVGNPAWMPG